MSLSRSAVTALATLTGQLLLTAPCLGRDLPPENPRGRIPDQALVAPSASSVASSDAAEAPSRPPLRLLRAGYPGALQDRPGAPAAAEPELPALLVPARSDAALREVAPQPADPPRWSNPGAVSL